MSPLSFSFSLSFSLSPFLLEFVAYRLVGSIGQDMMETHITITLLCFATILISCGFQAS